MNALSWRLTDSSKVSAEKRKQIQNIRIIIKCVKKLDWKYHFVGLSYIFVRIVYYFERRFSY